LIKPEVTVLHPFPVVHKWIRNEAFLVEIEVDLQPFGNLFPVHPVGDRGLFEAGEQRREPLLAVEDVLDRLAAIRPELDLTDSAVALDLVIGLPQQERTYRIVLVDTVEQTDDLAPLPYKLTLEVGDSYLTIPDLQHQFIELHLIRLHFDRFFH
jgi:hypothetical protein